MQTFHQIAIYLRRIAWTVIVAYMLGIHNVYKQEEKTADDIVLTVVEDDVQEDSAPKD